MDLPAPVFDGAMSLEKSLYTRRTIRAFLPAPVEVKHLAQLLWAAQGTTDRRKFKRTAPSGGALYPVDVYAVTGEGGVSGLDPGIYHYQPSGHSISLTLLGDFRSMLAKASLEQMWMARPPVQIVLTVEYKRICGKYGERGIRYATMEAGHIGQNIFLQAEALGLGAGIVGAFLDAEVRRIMALPAAHEPLLIMPVGYKAKE